MMSFRSIRWADFGAYVYHFSHIGIWMCRGRDMNVLVMDVEGTDGRERGEDQVCLGICINSNPNRLNSNFRILNANRRYFPLPHQKSLLSISGNTRLVCIRVLIWASSRPSSRLISVYLGRDHKKGKAQIFPIICLLTLHLAVQVSAHFSYLLSAITSERLLSQISKRH